MKATEHNSLQTEQGRRLHLWGLQCVRKGREDIKYIHVSQSPRIENADRSFCERWTDVLLIKAGERVRMYTKVSCQAAATAALLGEGERGTVTCQRSTISPFFPCDGQLNVG